jgi:hypothetical protein
MGDDDDDDDDDDDAVWSGSMMPYRGPHVPFWATK